jgi:hypothetical protein
MPLINPYVLLLAALQGVLDPDRGQLDYVSRDTARKRLVHLAGEDFGDDVQKWLEWLVSRGYLAPDEYTINPK